MLTVQRWSDARPAGRVRCWQEQCGEHKRRQQKVQLTAKYDKTHHANLGMINLSWVRGKGYESIHMILFMDQLDYSSGRCAMCMRRFKEKWEQQIMPIFL